MGSQANCLTKHHLEKQKAAKIEHSSCDAICKPEYDKQDWGDEGCHNRPFLKRKSKWENHPADT